MGASAPFLYEEVNMATQVFKGGKSEWVDTEMLHSYLQNGYTVDNKPKKAEKPKPEKVKTEES